jgi:hypothetical protein
MAYSERAKGSPMADFVAENAQVLSTALFFVVGMILFSAADTNVPDGWQSFEHRASGGPGSDCGGGDDDCHHNGGD